MPTNYMNHKKENSSIIFINKMVKKSTNNQQEWRNLKGYIPDVLRSS